MVVLLLMINRFSFVCDPNGEDENNIVKDDNGATMEVIALMAD